MANSPRAVYTIQLGSGTITDNHQGRGQGRSAGFQPVGNRRYADLAGLYQWP